jgi:hypothetical protein
MTVSKQANRADARAVKKLAAQAGKKRAVPVSIVTGPKRPVGEDKSRSKRALLIERISRPEGAQIEDLRTELGGCRIRSGRR